jgi:hypothetical protein
MNKHLNDIPSLETINQIIAQAHDQVVLGLIISAGMLVAILSFLFMALNLRHLALCFAFIYSGLLCFIECGLSEIIGPLGCIITSLGLIFLLKHHI